LGAIAKPGFFGNGKNRFLDFVWNFLCNYRHKVQHIKKLEKVKLGIIVIFLDFSGFF
jgi:hypothetical protein